MARVDRDRRRWCREHLGHGGDRRDACRFPGGEEGRDDRDDDSYRHAHDHRATEDGEGPIRQARPCGAQHGLESDGEQHTADHAHDRRDEGDDECLEDHHAGDLSAGCSDGAEQGELAGALGDGDPEGVGDDEGSDEHRDGGEGEQPDREEAQGLADLGGLLGVGVVDGDGKDIVREYGLDASHELIGRHVGRSGHGDRADLPFERQDALGLGELEDHQGRTGEVVLLTEAGQPDDLEGLDGSVEDDAYLLPDREVVGLRRADIDDDLAAGFGGAAVAVAYLDGGEGGGLHPRGGDRGRALATDRFAVGVDQLGEPIDGGLCFIHALDSCDGVEGLLRHGEDELAELVAELGVDGTNVDIGSGRDVAQQ